MDAKKEITEILTENGFLVEENGTITSGGQPLDLKNFFDYVSVTKSLEDELQITFSNKHFKQIEQLEKDEKPFEKIVEIVRMLVEKEAIRHYCNKAIITQLKSKPEEFLHVG